MAQGELTETQKLLRWAFLGNPSPSLGVYRGCILCCLLWSLCLASTSWGCRPAQKKSWKTCSASSHPPTCKMWIRLARQRQRFPLDNQLRVQVLNSRHSEPDVHVVSCCLFESVRFLMTTKLHFSRERAMLLWFSFSEITSRCAGSKRKRERERERERESYSLKT